MYTIYVDIIDGAFEAKQKAFENWQVLSFGRQFLS